MIICKLIQDNFQTNISLQIILIDPSSKYNHGISIIVWSLQTNMDIILLPLYRAKNGFVVMHCSLE